jgi:hypothetical protein
MQLFIPELGTLITLAEDWTFRITNEKRNTSLAKLMGRQSADYYYPFGTIENPIDEGQYGRRRIPIEPGNYTVAAGTTLEVDRIYIRKGNEEFSSVTFKTAIKGKLIRFFVSLEDANKIVF